MSSSAPLPLAAARETCVSRATGFRLLGPLGKSHEPCLAFGWRFRGGGNQQTGEAFVGEREHAGIQPRRQRNPQTQPLWIRIYRVPPSPWPDSESTVC